MKINYFSLNEAIDYLREFSCLDIDPTFFKRFRVKGTNYSIILANQLYPDSEFKTKLYIMNECYQVFSFEDFLDSMPPEIMQEFLFHIDMFR